MKRIKRFTMSLLTLILVFAMTVPGCGVYAAEQENSKIAIIHTNDVHGAIEGYAKVATLKHQLEEAGAYVLVMDAGDFMQGSVMVSDSKGVSAVELMNAVGYDVVTMGNHEFDYGFEVLEDAVEKLDAEFVVATVSKDGKKLFKSNTVFTAPDGTKIGVFGLNTPETGSKTNPKLTGGYDFCNDEELVTVAKSEVKELEDAGCDIIVCLAHLGIDPSSKGHRSVDILNEVDGIDILIDGHSHSTLADIQALEAAEGETTACLTSTGTKLANIGCIIIEKDGEADYTVASANVATANILDDPDVAALAKSINDDLDKKYGEVFATSRVELNGVKNDVRSKETNLGDLIADAMIWKCKKEGLSVDAALTNGGGIRANISVGEVTKKDVLNVLPFANTLFLITLKGSELLEALESATCVVPEIAGAYPQLAGIELTLDITKAFDGGEAYGTSSYLKPASINRVSIESVGGKPFDPDAVYNIAVNDYMAAGGDAYYVFANSDTIYDLGFDLAEAVIEYVKSELCGIIGSKYAYADTRVVVKSTDTLGRYKVKDGDCLWKIATDYYQAGKLYTRILDANRDLIADPTLIYPGQVFVIPAA